MKKLKIANHLSDKEFQDLIKKEKKIQQYKVWQVLYYIKSHFGEEAGYISQLFGISVPTIYHYVQKFNKYGKEGVTLKPKGGRLRYYLSLEEEKEILGTATDKAKQGLILTMNDIRSLFEDRIGHKVSDDYLWDLFKRHDWSKKAPRSKNPKQDLIAQEEFKKNSRKAWSP